MPRLHLGLVLHNHQPVGNYGFVIEQLYEQAYAPMLEALERHPGIRFAMHTSGPLIDWMEAQRPEYLDRLRGLCDRGQAEIVTGGYYEPILPMIPDADKAGQIAKMTAYIERLFGQRPTGLWLTERVWEPGLPAPLADAGAEWTLVDDAHFRMAGVSEERLDGYFITEEQGRRIALFPGSQRLRYTIPWLDVPDLMRELHERADTSPRDDAYIVLGDDGEKFGGWPTTHAHVWERGWIDRFFGAVEEAADWLEVITPGAYMRRFPARGLVYLPAASYAEMMEWALPTEDSVAYHRAVVRLEEEHRDDALPFVRGGFWRAFLAKYPEANAMHKRGLRIDAALARHDDAAARDALWQAQCNCPYWHGVFGGLYLRNIRAATNANLVRAERLAATAAHAPLPHASVADYDYDGRDEALLQTEDISLLLHPSAGGMLSEFDLRQRDAALLDVLTRRREPYHEALLEGTAGQTSGDVTNIHGGVRLKEQGLAEALVFDRHRRGGLQEWLLAPGADVASFARGDASASFEPDGGWSLTQSAGRDGIAAELAREHDGWRITKRIAVPASGERLDVTYECANTSADGRQATFVSEWNLSPPQAPEGDDRIARIESPAGMRELAGAPGEMDATWCVVRGSAGYGPALAADDPELRLWHFPVFSVSSSEGGLERVWQGASVSVVRALDLAPGGSVRIAFSWRTVDVVPVEHEG